MTDDNFFGQESGPFKPFSPASSESPRVHMPETPTQLPPGEQQHAWVSPEGMQRSPFKICARCVPVVSSPSDNIPGMPT